MISSLYGQPMDRKGQQVTESLFVEILKDTVEFIYNYFLYANYIKIMIVKHTEAGIRECLGLKLLI